MKYCGKLKWNPDYDIQKRTTDENPEKAKIEVVGPAPYKK